MNEPPQWSQDLHYVRGLVDNAARPHLPRAVVLIWAAIVLFGFPLPDFVAQGAVFRYWSVVGPIGFLLCALLSARAMRQSGQHDVRAARRQFAHWGVLFLTGGLALLSPLTGSIDWREIAPLMLLLVSFACPAGTSENFDDSLAYVVNVDTGVTSAAAGSSITGDRDPTTGCPNDAATLHDSEPESDACAAKTLSTAVEEEVTATPTALLATETPAPTPTALALPSTGGAPGDGFDSRVGLLIILAAAGVGFALAGRAAMVAARRRIE